MDSDQVARKRFELENDVKEEEVLFFDEDKYQ